MEFLLGPVGIEDKLVSLRVSVEPRLLEDLLEVLARLDFPGESSTLSPAGPGHGGIPGFSSTRVDDVREALSNHGLSAFSLEVNRVQALARNS
jgi:hypothetical protein